MSELPKDNALIRITIDPTKVVDILTSTASVPKDRLTPATIELTWYPRIGGVAQMGPLSPIIFHRPMNMVFWFADRSIRPIGMAFKAGLDNMPTSTHIANLNMPFEHIRFEAVHLEGSAPSIVVPNLYISPPEDVRVGRRTYSWEFFIMFQTLSGAIGVIDPDVENDYTQ